MKVSIAVPSLNYGRFVGQCLASLAGQENVDLEVLIADGGSTDDSLQIVRRYCERDRRFRLIGTQDDGQADAVKRALSGATGEIFGFLNADDFLLCRDALSSVVDAFNSRLDVDVVSFSGFYADEQGRKIRPVRLRHHPFDSLAWMKYRAAVLQPATFWRRKVSETVTQRTEFHYVFDAVFFYEAYRRFSWQEFPKPIAGYRLHGANKSVSVRSARIFELARYEQIKFGAGSPRAAYLRRVAASVRICERMPAFGGALLRLIYLGVNCLAYLTAYRVPGI